MGLQVAQELARRKSWHVHVLDANKASYDKLDDNLKSITTFHHVDITVYKDLATAFDSIFSQEKGRLDFVFANAGIGGSPDFYKRHEPGSGPPPQLDTFVVDVNVTALYTTTYLALHYFRQCQQLVDDASIVITASCGGFYPVASMPEGVNVRIGDGLPPKSFCN